MQLQYTLGGFVGNFTFEMIAAMFSTGNKQHLRSYRRQPKQIK
jgi:hypothetical protein